MCRPSHFRSIHCIDMQPIYTIARKVNKLLTGKLNACPPDTCRILSSCKQALYKFGWDSCSTGKRHTLNLALAGKRHDASHNGNFYARTIARITEAIEQFVIKEKLRNEKIRTRILLGFEMLHGA